MINQLATSEAQKQVLAIASGRHDVEGQLIWTNTTGASPTHQLVLRQALGKGTWEGPESVYYKGLKVTDYEFRDGSQTAASPTYFPTDTNPHTGTVLLDLKAPVGVGDPDTKTTVPEKARAIVKTEKFPDFDEDGNQIDPADNSVVVANTDLIAGTSLDESYFTYTPNPARVLAGWLFKYGKIAHTRINWPKWCDWRDYCAGTETVDYRTIPGFLGIGLRGSYYDGTSFDTLKETRIDPAISFAQSSGAPNASLPADNFSVKWFGYIKPKYSEGYTFSITHDDGARLYIDGTLIIDEWATTGTHTGTVTLTANHFHVIEIHWFNGLAPSQFSLSWSSTSQTSEVVKTEALYPSVTTASRYEAHVSFSTPTTLDDVIKTILDATNSIRQEVGGRMEFYCVEQLSSSFHFSDTNRTILDGFTYTSSPDVRDTELQNVFEASFRDLDSAYLRSPLVPIQIKVDALIASAGREIFGSVIPLPNMTQWQAYKVLKYRVERSVGKVGKADFGASALSFPAITGDLVTLSFEKTGFIDKEFQIIETTDDSPEETADTRKITLQET